LKRDLRRQIKQDELLTGFERLIIWVRTHQDEAKVTAVVLLALTLGAGVLWYAQGRRTRAAEQALAEALEIFHAPVETELRDGGDRPPGPIYPTTAEKLKKAVAAFDGVDRHYASLPAGLRARYYGAVCRVEMESYADAEKILVEIASHRDQAVEPALARLEIAELHYRQGHWDKAADAYRQLVADSSFPLPRDHALMRLASTLEEAHRLAEARASYRRLTEEFPLSVYAQQARRRVEYLAASDQG